MRPSLVIARLREACPIFANRVAGSAHLRNAIDNDNLAVPHAFVVLLSDRTDGDTSLGDLAQEITTRFAVVVAVANTSDERGQGAMEVLCDVKRDLLRALVGWSPDLGAYAPVLYEGMPDDPDSSRARAWVQFDFASSAFGAEAL